MRRLASAVTIAVTAAVLAAGSPALATDQTDTFGASTPAQVGHERLDHGAGPRGGIPDALSAGVRATKGPSKRDVIKAFQEELVPLLTVPVKWTGNAKTCKAGGTSSNNKKATLDAVNYFRSMNNLAPVSLHKTYSKKAQAAALIMKANGYLSHYPPKNAKCYTSAGYDGASHSNLYLSWGYPGPLAPSTGARAVTGYMVDSGDNNTAAGHRHWILDQGMSQIGSGDTDTSNALYVVGNLKPAANPKWVSWPSVGYFPRQLEPNGRWSIAHPNASFANAKVTVTTPNGKLKVKPERGSKQGTLTWDMKLPAAYAKNPGKDYTIKVTVSNIKLNGTTVSRNWQTTLVNAAP